MTKERKLEILKDLLIQLSDSANILCTCEADERCEVVEECIKTLEQQPSDDCVSRQAVINLINEDWKYEGLELSVNELPPVTPTHGTCMDCKHNRPNSYARTMFSCENGHRFKLRDCENFYCADFEKRGTENG